MNKSFFIILPATILALLSGCDFLTNPQTTPNTSQIPWGKITGKIVFVNQDEGEYADAKHLYVIDGQSKSLTEVKTSSSDDFYDPVISPRGDQIAYDGKVENFDLNLLNLSNGNITTYQRSVFSGFTRHNTLVSYYFYPNATREMRINGVKVNIPIDPNSNIAFGPNDEFLVYSTEAQSGVANQLIKFNLMDSTSQIIVGDTATQANNPDVSQDGRMVIYSKSFNSAHRWTEIWLTNIDGSNDHKIISGDHLDFDFPMWSPDDKYIVCSSSVVYDTFYGGYAVGTNIWLYDVAKDTTQQLLNINGYNSSWSKQ